MERSDILIKLQDIFINILDNEGIELLENTTANDIEEWDSLTHIQLIVEIEKEFFIRFNSKEIRKWNNIGEMIDSILEKIKK
ncbi:MAG: acyl carrier protein [Bacteroidales bacterium]|nr:acyl carrier protein [Bacteroidales bacterium]